MKMKNLDIDRRNNPITFNKENKLELLVKPFNEMKYTYEQWKKQKGLCDQDPDRFRDEVILDNINYI